MTNLDVGGFNLENEQSLSEKVQERWNVDLNNDPAVLSKIVELQGKMPDTAELSNFWKDYQQQKEKDENNMKKVA